MKSLILCVNFQKEETGVLFSVRRGLEGHFKLQRVHLKGLYSVPWIKDGSGIFSGLNRILCVDKKFSTSRK